jgi:DNA gyrase/topoisomerase IV subunit B
MGDLAKLDRDCHGAAAGCHRRIPSTQGGTHEPGFRAAIVKAMWSFLDDSGLLPKNLNLTAEDIREGIVGVLSKVLSHKELQDVVSALGCGVGEQFNLERLRYHKIIFMMDADSDGHHIATLLLTFFCRHLRPLIEGSFVYLA